MGVVECRRHKSVLRVVHVSFASAPSWSILCFDRTRPYAFGFIRQHKSIAVPLTDISGTIDMTIASRIMDLGVDRNAL